MTFSFIASSSTCSTVLPAESSVVNSKSFKDYSTIIPTVDTSKLKAKMQYALTLLPKNLEKDRQQRVNSLLDNLIEVYAESAVKKNNLEPPNKKMKLQPRLFRQKET
ncbi:hypothetical protein JTE90_003516 [Oedothorax gibbosus]|uniref:BESS domain-containing protein n=1 Tax=Oedothorax gibbosus TaxID=931172 RepID=A0AAV6TM45_9ARAC|nr:hypothetical protein JTE90_003516 [Oedothorax gibbosus]